MPLLRSLGRFIERLSYLSLLGTAPSNDHLSPLVVRPLTEHELAQAKFIDLLSAVDHLSEGVTRSAFHGDSYLKRLQDASPEDRRRALEHYDYTATDYDRWVSLYGQTAAVH